MIRDNTANSSANRGFIERLVLRTRQGRKRQRREKKEPMRNSCGLVVCAVYFNVRQHASSNGLMNASNPEGLLCNWVIIKKCEFELCDRLYFFPLAFVFSAFFFLFLTS